MNTKYALICRYLGLISLFINLKLQKTRQSGFYVALYVNHKSLFFEILVTEE